MTSYHEYNKYEKGRKLVEKLQDGMNIALITDAGTPGISDPGEELVKMCYEAGISVTSLPGQQPVLQHLHYLDYRQEDLLLKRFFQRIRRKKELVLQEIERETRTIIMYEAPHRLLKTLKMLSERLGKERRITICRELTKRHETAFCDDIRRGVCIL